MFHQYIAYTLANLDLGTSLSPMGFMLFGISGISTISGTEFGK